MPVRCELGEEHRLVGEDVRGVVVEVVEREQLVVEEARRPRAREHVRGLHPLDVLPRRAPSGSTRLSRARRVRSSAGKS